MGVIRECFTVFEIWESPNAEGEVDIYGKGRGARSIRKDISEVFRLVELFNFGERTILDDTDSEDA